MSIARILAAYLDRESAQIIFQAGIHSNAIRMRYQDFAPLALPIVAEFHRSPLTVW